MQLGRLRRALGLKLQQKVFQLGLAAVRGSDGLGDQRRLIVAAAIAEGAVNPGTYPPFRQFLRADLCEKLLDRLAQRQR